MRGFFHALGDYILYGSAFLCNILVIFCTPDIYSNAFLFVYSITSLFFGVFVVLIFGVKKLALISKWILLSLIPLLCVFFLFQNYILLWFIYTITLLVSDYVASQKGSSFVVKFNRSINIISALPFYIYPNFFVELIILRVVIFLLISFSIFSNNRDFARLNLKSPFIYVISTHLAYFLPLIIVSHFFDGTIMKFWYLGFQISLGFILKTMDYSIRKNSQRSELINLATIFVVGIAPLILMLSYPNYFLLFIYLVSSAFLLNLQYRLLKYE